MTRLLVVVAVVGLVLAAAAWWRAAHARHARSAHPTTRFPGWVTSGADRTWVVFTTEYCATCGPVAEDLRGAFPDDRLVIIDVVEQAGLSRDFSVRRAPTVFLADRRGAVSERLVGPDAVRLHTAAAATA